MKFRDLVSLPLGNLWRIKLRSALTISGVMIAIGAFVSMLSFGAGNQQYVTEQWNELGLFSTMYVYPPRDEPVGDTVPSPILNDSTLAWLSGLDGIDLAYPFDSYNVMTTLSDTSISCEAQALPLIAAQTRLFSRIKAGVMFSSDSAKGAVVTTRFLRELDIEEPDSVLGQQLIIAVERARLDSGLMAVVGDVDETIDRVFRDGWRDSIRDASYIKNLVQTELNTAVGRFANGFFNSPALVVDTLTITGVLKSDQGRFRFSPILVPVATANRFASGGLSTDPTELFTALSGGTLLQSSNQLGPRQYPRVTLQLDRHTNFQTIKDTVEAHGYSTFSYAEQFEEITRFFLYFDMALGLIGLIALTTASLGIVNTMVMSIMERCREIGVLMSLGASRQDIRILYLFESALIGFVGAGAGIVLGWLVARVASAIAQYYMVQEGIDPVDLFALPWWLVLIAFAFGLVVSIAAGAYPASRAARVDPMEALRAE